MDTNLRAYGLVLLGAMLWGTTGTAQALAPKAANPIAIGATRIAIGGFALLAISLCRGSLKVDKSWPILATIIAAVSMAAYQPFFFTAISKTGVAVGTVVAIGSAPVLAGFLSLLIGEEKLEKKWYLATGLAIVGCAIILLPDSGDSISISGVLLALGAGLSYAVYTLASKRLLVKYPSDTVVAVVFSISAILLTPVFFIHDFTWLMELRGICVALHLGFFATALAYLFFAKGLKVLPVATVVTLTLAEPLTAALLGIVLVGEKITYFSLVGILLLLIGLIILSTKIIAIK